MKKILLIPILLIAGAISASACGSCAAHNKADAKACPAECAKACCADEACATECAKACCTKDAAAASAKDGKKACCPMS